MLRRTLSILTVLVVAVLVGVLGLSLVTAQSSDGPTATRSFEIDSATVMPGGVVVVTITHANAGALGRITETLPAGFRYVTSSVDPVNVSVTGQVVTGQMVSFTLLEVESPFTYTVTASNTLGPHDFSGVVRDSDRVEKDVVGDRTVTVQTDAPSMPTSTATQPPVTGGAARATRSFHPASVAPGGEVVVTITHANAGALGRITETLPAGFRYVTSSVDPVNVSVTGQVVTGQVVSFTLLEVESPFTYTVTASNTLGPHDFSGVVRDSDRVEKDVVGDRTVTVQTDAPSMPTSTATQPPVTGGAARATRSFDPASVAPGGEVVVTITHANAGALGRITETLPAEFRYVTSSVDPVNVSVTGQVVTGQMVSFTLLEVESPFTYTVTASNTYGPHDFSGVVRDSDKMENAVGGASDVTVGARAERSLSPTVVNSGGRVVVTITHANAGDLGRITETLPAGFRYVTSSVDPVNVSVTGQVVSFTLLEVESPFTYTVTASRTAASHTFSGIVRDSDRRENAVGGASSVRVRTPSTGTGGGGGTGSGGDTGGGTPATTTPAGSPPIIAGGTREEFNVSENMTAVTSLSIVDGRTVTWNISGGFDAAEFTIGAESGELTFRAAPDFENPTDEGANNVYVVVVGATDSDTLSDTLLVLVTVTDVVDESTATPTPEPTATLAPTPTPEPTATPTAAPTATPVATATSMPEPTATSMPEPTATSMPEPTATSAPVATATSMPAATVTSMPEPTATSMPEPTATSMPAPTATSMPAPTAVAPEEPGGGFPIWALLLIIVAVGGAIVGAVVLRSRRS